MTDSNDLLNFSIGTTKYILNVPPVVVGAIIAATIAGLTTVFNNQNSRRQVQMQLDHAARDKSLELKHEVFIRAAAWAQAIINATFRLSKLELDAQTLGSELGDLSHVIAEIEIVGNEKTIESALRLNNAFGATFSRLAADRNKLDEEMTLLRAFREEKAKQPVGSLGQLRAHSALLAKGAEIEALYVPYSTRVQDEVVATVAMAAELTLCMRAELGLTINADSYREIADRLNREARSFQRQTLETLFPPKSAGS